MAAKFNGRNGTETLLCDAIVVLAMDIAAFLRQWVVRGEVFGSRYKSSFTWEMAQFPKHSEISSAQTNMDSVREIWYKKNPSIPRWSSILACLQRASWSYFEFWRVLYSRDTYTASKDSIARLPPIIRHFQGLRTSSVFYSWNQSGFILLTEFLYSNF